MKEPLIDRAREAFAANRGLRRNIIDELIFALTVANKEVERLRESNDALLAAARFTVAYYDGQLDGAGLRITMIKLKAAIANAAGAREVTCKLTDLAGDLYASADLVCEQRDALLAAAKTIQSAFFYGPFTNAQLRALDLLRAAIAKAEELGE